MIVKTFELRDRATFVPVVAIKLEPGNEADAYLLHRSGYQPGETHILMGGLDGGLDRLTCDPYDWGGNGTRLTAHLWLRDHFDEVESGSVIDAEFIRGESAAPKESERVA